MHHVRADGRHALGDRLDGVRAIELSHLKVDGRRRPDEPKEGGAGGAEGEEEGEREIERLEAHRLERRHLQQVAVLVAKGADPAAPVGALRRHARCGGDEREHREIVRGEGYESGKAGEGRAVEQVERILAEPHAANRARNHGLREEEAHALETSKPHRLTAAEVAREEEGDVVSEGVDGSSDGVLQPRAQLVVSIRRVLLQRDLLGLRELVGVLCELKACEERDTERAAVAIVGEAVRQRGARFQLSVRVLPAELVEHVANLRVLGAYAVGHAEGERAVWHRSIRIEQEAHVIAVVGTEAGCAVADEGARLSKRFVRPHQSAQPRLPHEHLPAHGRRVPLHPRRMLAPLEARERAARDEAIQEVEAQPAVTSRALATAPQHHLDWRVVALVRLFKEQREHLVFGVLGGLGGVRGLIGRLCGRGVHHRQMRLQDQPRTMQVVRLAVLQQSPLRAHFWRLPLLGAQVV